MIFFIAGHVFVFPFAGSKDHIKVQGEILEGLVARVVSCDSSKHMEKVLKDFPPPALDGGELGSKTTSFPSILVNVQSVSAI